MALVFTKMQATGNDFIVLDGRTLSSAVAYSDLSRQLADRRFGVGADQVLFLEPSTSCDFRMRVFNADGSEAEMSGNGMRCFAKFLFDQNIVQSSEMLLETLAGPIRAHVLASSRGEKTSRIAVDMGVAEYRGRLALASPEIANWDSRHFCENAGRAHDQIWLHCVTIGNPHAVLFVHDVESVPLADWGPVVENHSAFPARTNFEVVSQEASGRVRQRTWERGAGETLSCGTGACAVAKTLFQTGQKHGAVTIDVRGGQIQVLEQPDGGLRQSGPAELVFVGEWCRD